jgi:exportin-1
MVLVQLQGVIPMDTNLVAAYDNGDEESCLFVSRLALFLSTFLKSYGNLFENTSNPEHQEAIVNALTYLVMISEVNDEEQDGEVFKSCLEFWYHFAKDLFVSDDYKSSRNSSTALDSFSAWGGSGGTNPSSAQSSRRVAIYGAILHRLRIVIIDKMAKPEEVIIVEDDDGNIVREMTKDTEVIAQYKTMRETIIYLTHLNYEDTEAIMLGKLELQIDGGEFTWNGLNTLCWAIGSISGAMGEMDEKRFLVTVIKDLLRLCEEQRGKDNKAVVASNIMYIVGQYPRFLRAHWKFLKTVVNKLFEFMHEPHPGVQDMACDTFLKIAQKCKRKFMTVQTDEQQPFILTLIGELHRHIGDLQPHQVQAFYEAVATMLSDKGQAILLSRDETVVSLMTLPNASFQDILAQGNVDVSAMFQLETVKELQKIFRTNTRVCGAVGSIFIHQMSNIFVDMLNVYRLYSDHILEACQQQGEVATRYTLYKAMRGVKSEILDLLTAFFENISDLENGPEIMMTTFMPHICQEILTDYQKTVPSARDARVLKLFGAAIGFLREHLSPQVPQIMDAVFEPTLEMITKNMMDYPDHRTAFFSFLRQANTHCFYGLFSIPAQQQKLVVDSVVWAFKHTERNISETGLEILFELLQNVSQSMDVAQPFHQQFLLPLIQDIIGIMTDRLHKSGFKQQATVLQHMFQILEMGQLVVALVDASSGLSAPVAADGSVDNKTFVKEYVGNLLLTSFPNLSRDQIVSFVVGLFESSQDLQAFKQHLRDFLIAVKEFANEDNSELFTEETEANQELQRQQQMQYKASVPGLMTPQEIFDEDPDL